MLLLSPQDMLDGAEASNEALTWILRIVTLGGVVVSLQVRGRLIQYKKRENSADLHSTTLQMVTAPISVAPDIIPLCGSLIGDMVGCLLCCFNVCLGCCCW